MIHTHLVALFTKRTSLYLSLLAHLFLLNSPTVHAMEVPLQQNSEPSFSTQVCRKGIENNIPSLVKISLLEGADVNYTDKDGKSLFYLAFLRNNKEILEALITHPNIDMTAHNRQDTMPLHIACKLGLSTTVESMLNRYPQAINCVDDGLLPLHIAVLYGHKECVKLLADKMNNIDQQCYNQATALHYACFNEDFDIITLLIQKNASTTIKNQLQETPLLHLYTRSKLTPFNQFITDNPAIAHTLIHTTDHYNNNQFHLCTSAVIDGYPPSGFKRYLLFLIEQGLNIHARNNNGKTPVDLAYDEYTESYEQYSKKKISDFEKVWNRQEKILHYFLRVTSPLTQSVLFKEILSQFKDENCFLLAELIQLIMLKYYALNIETIVAKQHADYCYNNCIEKKIITRNKLIKDPEPALLWSSS